MNRYTQKTTPIRAFLLRYVMLMSLVAALTMPPTDAQASGWLSTGEVVLYGTVALSVLGMGVASGVVLISDAIDLFGEPEPTALNVGWNIGLAVPTGILCTIGAVNASPQDGGKVGATIAACTVSALLLSHGIWELSLLDEMGSREESLLPEDRVTMSFGPTLLDAKGAFGLGMVGRF